MKDQNDTTPAEKDGKYEFQLHYSGREVPCTVVKEQDKVTVCIEDKTNAVLTVQPDGSWAQTSGDDLADSAIDYIRKRILG
ncbi:hypothetical protein [Mucilaginibacter glaciei]|uniref:Uncharacterized protein n=1 Tax=Mucilaginibacter glaciei TaxID=2772109 RepID=A0A926NSE4_9SPHI|nr:hypothetical protein [Mucilaginibacter glaciei]MBD1394157.1 hypothetical protein [Mucilaginibacter glaciei]